MARPPGPLVLRKTYDNQQFADVLQKVLDRMAFLAERDGPINERFPIPHHAWRMVEGKVRTYTTTGDPEFILDAACYALIEFTRPSVPSFWMDNEDHDNPAG